MQGNTQTIRIVSYLSVACLACGDVAAATTAEAAGTQPDLLTFIGRFHPMILHFPIGLLTALVLLELLAWRLKRPEWHLATSILCGITAISAACAAGLGLALAAGGGYDAELLIQHRNSGVAFAVLTALLCGFKVAGYKAAGSWPKRAYAGTLFVAFNLMGLAGHLGGSLSHGSNYLFEHMPLALQTALQIDDDEAGTHHECGGTYAMNIQPILEQHCYRCHGPEKQKGDYRMDTAEGMMQAGESEETPIVPGAAMQSYLVKLITRPREEDEAMPPEGKEQLSAGEILAIIDWINRGALLE